MLLDMMGRALLAFLLISCARRPAPETIGTASSDSDASARPAAAEPAAGCTATPLVPSATIKSEVLPCDGACPTYRVTVRGDGSVDYEGDRNVAVSGRQSSRLDASTTRALFERAECGAFGPQPKPSSPYGGGISGISQAAVTLDVGQGARTLKAGRSRTCNTSSEPHASALCELSYAIDEAIHVDRWVGFLPRNGRERVRDAGTPAK
jgi:hypothetical protein